MFYVTAAAGFSPEVFENTGGAAGTRTPLGISDPVQAVRRRTVRLNEYNRGRVTCLIVA